MDPDNILKTKPKELKTQKILKRYMKTKTFYFILLHQEGFMFCCSSFLLKKSKTSNFHQMKKVSKIVTLMEIKNIIQQLPEIYYLLSKCNFKKVCRKFKCLCLGLRQDMDKISIDRVGSESPRIQNTKVDLDLTACNFSIVKINRCCICLKNIRYINIHEFTMTHFYNLQYFPF